MKKMMKVVVPTVAVGVLAATSYLIAKNKKNMLDIIIEEIETMK